MILVLLRIITCEDVGLTNGKDSPRLKDDALWLVSAIV